VSYAWPLLLSSRVAMKCALGPNMAHLFMLLSGAILSNRDRWTLEGLTQTQSRYLPQCFQQASIMRS
jgi:hypothetical protein